MAGPDDTTTQDDPTKTADGAEPSPGDQPPKKTPTESEANQARIDQLTKGKNDALRRAEKAEREATALKRKMDAGTRPTPPDPAAYTDAEGRLIPAKWQQAQTKYEDELFTWREAQGAAPSASPAPADGDAAATPPSFVEGVQKLAEQHPDIFEVIERPVFTPAMREAIWSSEIGAQIAYHLGQHQAEAMRIGGLSPVAVAREIGKIEAKLGAAPAASASRTVSSAPEPITPVGGATTTTTKDPEKMTTEEWMAWDKERTKERLKANPLGL